MKIAILGGLLVAALTITSAAQAQSHIPGINRTENRQEHRITRDVRHDRITRMQAYRLRREEMRFNRDKRMAMADGRITRGERRHLRREENRIRHTIRRDERADHAS